MHPYMILNLLPFLVIIILEITQLADYTKWREDLIKIILFLWVIALLIQTNYPWLRSICP